MCNHPRGGPQTTGRGSSSAAKELQEERVRVGQQSSIYVRMCGVRKTLKCGSDVGFPVWPHNNHPRLLVVVLVIVIISSVDPYYMRQFHSINCTLTPRRSVENTRTSSSRRRTESVGVRRLAAQPETSVVVGWLVGWTAWLAAERGGLSRYA